MSDAVNATFVLGLLAAFVVDKFFQIKERIAVRKDQVDILIKSIDALGRQWDRDRQEYREKLNAAFERETVLRGQLASVVDKRVQDFVNRRIPRVASAINGTQSENHLIDPENLEP